MHPPRATGHLATFGVRLPGPPDRLRLALPDGLGEGRTGICRHWGGGFAMNDLAKTRQAVSAAVIGNVLEWYDFAVYGFVATIIAKNLFPPGSEASALLGTYLTIGIGFIARPLGGIVIGCVGDHYGRKAAL